MYTRFMINKKDGLTSFDLLLAEGRAAWWQMELPSGEVIFSDNKTRMLGYEEGRF